MLLLALATLSPAQAASLDLIEVGGMWGSPGATNPTAVWWNPAGIAVGGGHQITLEAAPNFATVNFERTQPTYAPITNTLSASPKEYDYAGSEKLTFNGVVPFLGVSSDLTLDGFGIGAALAVPTARGGTVQDAPGAGRYHLREGNIQAIYAMLAAGYHIGDKFALGVSGAYVDSTWTADTDAEGYTALQKGLQDEFNLPEPPGDDAYIEDGGYATNVIFDHLKDNALTFGVGMYATPIDTVGISLSYNHGVDLHHTGDLSMSFDCPPEWDVASRLAATTGGLCDTDITGEGTIGYKLPGRFNLGVVFTPIDKLRLEIMGAYVMWSDFTDYEITTQIGPDQITVDDTTDADGNGFADQAEESAELASQDRLWARDNRDTFWAGVDGKFQAHQLLLVGGRVLYDHSAIPSEVLSTNNFDTEVISLGALAALTPVPQLRIGLSYQHQFMLKRTVTDSIFAVTLDEDAALADRYFYPEMNGTHSGSVNRLGVSVSGAFGGG